MFPILNPPPSSLPIPSLWVVPVHQPQASSIVHRTWASDSFHIWYYTYFIFFNFIFKLYIIVLVLPNIQMNPPQVYMCSPSWTLLPPPSPHHPSGSKPFSQIIPPSPSPSPIESKRLFYTSVSLLLSHIQGYCYYLSKFHIYALVYCIGVFLSGLLHSV